MANSIKYLKDESGNKISPIVSTKSVYLESSKSAMNNFNVTEWQIVYDGAVNIGTGTNKNITISKPLTSFQYVAFILSGFMNIYNGNCNHGILVYWQHPNDDTKREWLLNWSTVRGSTTVTIGCPEFRDHNGYTQAYQYAFGKIYGYNLKS